MKINFDHFTIRLLTHADLSAYFDMVESNRKRLEDFFTGTVSRTQTYEDTRSFLDEMIKRSEARNYFPFIIIDNTNTKFIGFLDIKNIDWNIPKAELGCYVDKVYASKGLMKKAFKLFADQCFIEYDFAKLFLRTHYDNTAARKLAESAGFDIEGTIRRDYKTTSGELVDLIYYGRIQ